jgi:gliding motility-associated-like protein
VDSVTIYVNQDCGEVFVPKAFSPNGDGQNDFECLYGRCLLNVDFSIYDRWGEKVFEATNISECWDGTYRGQPMNPAVFVYYLNATLLTGETITKKGNITLVK